MEGRLLPTEDITEKGGRLPPGDSVIEEEGRWMSEEGITEEEGRLLPSTAEVLTGLVLEAVCKDCDCVVLVRLSQTS